MEIWLKINLTLSIIFAFMYIVEKAFEINKKVYSEIGGAIVILCVVSWFLYSLVRVWL